MINGEGHDESDFLECLTPLVVSTLPVLTHLLFTTTLRGSRYYAIHFTNEVTETWKV